MSFWGLGLITSPVIAQEPLSVSESGPLSHAEVLAGIAEACLAGAVSDQSSFRVLAQGQAGSVASTLVQNWNDAGKSIFLNSSGNTELNLLTYTVDRAEISLKRLTRKNVLRVAELGVTYWLSDPMGKVLSTNSCFSRLEDVLSRDSAKQMADARHTATSPDLPQASRLRQALEPIILIGASAVGTYLFFNLRSRRASSG